MAGTEMDNPRLLAELSPDQLWRISRHPSVWGLGMGWGLFSGVLIGVLIWSSDLIFALTDQLGGLPFRGIWFALTGFQVALTIGIFLVASHLRRSHERQLVTAFLAEEKERARPTEMV